MSYNKIQALRDNVEAIKAVFGNNTRDQFSSEQMDVIRKFSGFGGIKEVYHIDHYKTHDDVVSDVCDVGMDMARLLHELNDVIRDNMGDDTDVAECIESIKTSPLNAFYTPNEVIDAVGGALRHTLGVFGIKSSTFIEPSAGIGGFLPAAPDGCQTVAFEIDPITARILSVLHPDTEVHATGFERIADEMPDRVPFDIAASNIPFSRYGVHDAEFERGDEVHRNALRKIHRYFFVKAMDELEDGGILAFVTSRGIADSVECEYLRRWLVEKGNLLAALRLPDNLFVNTSGVEVGSDIIVVQRDSKKRWQSVAETQFIESVTKNICIDGRSEQVEDVNRLMSQRKQAVFTHRRLAINQYGKMKVSYYWREGMDKFKHSLEDMLCRDMERNFRRSTWNYGHDDERKQRERDASDANIERMRKGREATERLRREMRPYYDKLMKAYADLHTKEQRDKCEYPFERQEMNDAYNFIVQKWGSLHKNEHIIKDFPEYLHAMSLERKQGKQWVRADIFDHPVDFHVVTDGERISPMDALGMSINEYGKVNMPYIMKVAGLSMADAYEALKGEIFLYPEAKDDANCFLEWQHKNKTINGNVMVKARAIQSYVSAGEIDEFSRKVLADTEFALRNALPKTIEYDEIDIQFGARWIPTSFYERFMQWLFRCNPTTITYIPEIDKFSFEYPDYYYNSLGWMSGPYALRDKGYSGFAIFEFALADKVPEIKKSVWVTKPGSNERVKVKIQDGESIRAVQNKVDEIRSKFDDYLHSPEITDEQRAELVKIYNENMNSSIRANFDGSMQTFPGLDYKALGIEDLYQSQKDAIWMIKNNGGGICWHEVGGGKTLIMCVAAMEMKRLGLCNKPMIIALKANVAQIAETFRKAYPNARVLFPGKKEFTKKQRKEMLEQIANNDWDCVILSHSQFDLKVPQDPDDLRAVITEELKDLEDATHWASSNGRLTRDAARGLAERKKTLQNRLQKLNDKLKDKADDVLTFQKLGIDHIFVDESHKYKNLGFNTNYSRVAGIGESTGNDKTLNMYCAIRSIQKKTGRDLGATFLSGTIVVNALTELYALFKYLRPRELKRQHLHCFDAWAANFARKAVDYDLTMTCEIQEKERFRQYLNVPELSAMLREITDYRTAEMINIDRPRANIIEDFADPTPEQEVLLQNLIKLAETGMWSVMGCTEMLPPKNLESGTGLATCTLARKIALDARLMGEHQFSDHPNNKTSRVAANIAKYYRQFDDHKGVQMVFCDESVEANSKGKWNIYSDLREKLVERYAIPDHEIAFIHDYDSEDQKMRLFADLNAGRVRVVIGTTEKLGTGVNAQKRVVALHHIDTPWTPAALEQRNGRAIRTGNDVKIWGDNKVDIIMYGTNRTLDAYKMKTLQNKAFFLKQINNGTVARHFDESDMTEENGIPYAELVALLSGNQDLLEKARLDGKVALLEKSRKQHRNEQRAAESKINANHKEIENIRRAIALQQSDLADVEAYAKAHGGKSGIVVYHSKDDSVEEMARKLRYYRDLDYSAGVNLGEVFGGCFITMTSVHNSPASPGLFYNLFGVRCKSGIVYRVNKNGTLGNSNEECVNQWDRLPDAIRQRIADNQTGIRTREADIKVCEVTISTPWSKEAEYAELIAKQQEVTERVNAELAAREAAKAKAKHSDDDED